MSLSYDLDGVQMSQQQFLEAFPGGALHIALANTYMLGMRAEACQIFIQRPDLHQLILYNCTAPYDYETDDDQLLERGTFIEQFAVAIQMTIETHDGVTLATIGKMG